MYYFWSMRLVLFDIFCFMNKNFDIAALVVFKATLTVIVFVVTASRKAEEKSWENVITSREFGGRAASRKNSKYEKLLP